MPVIHFCEGGLEVDENSAVLGGGSKPGSSPLSMRTISSFMWRRGSRSVRGGLGFSVSWFFHVVEISWSLGCVVAGILQNSPAVGATRVGSALSALDAAFFGSSMSLRSFSRVGASLSMSGFLHLGSSLSLRGMAQLGSTLSVCGNIQLSDIVAASLSVMDLVNLASSLSFRSWARLGSSMSVLSESHFGASLSPRRFARLSSSLALFGDGRFGLLLHVLGLAHLGGSVFSLCRDPCGGESSEQGHTALDRSGVEDQGRRFGGSQSSRRIYCLVQGAVERFDIWRGNGSKEKADLEASLVQLGATSETLQIKISDLAGNIATAEAVLKATTAFRAKEHADFEKSEQELLDVIDTLARAIAILEEMKGGASMMQLQKAGSVVEALKVMVQASSFNSANWQPRKLQ